MGEKSCQLRPRRAEGSEGRAAKHKMGLVLGGAGKLLRTNPICGCSNTESWRLDLGGAAVHEEFDPVDETRIAGGEEEGDGRDLFRASHFATWDLGLEELLGVGSEGIKDWRVDRSGTEDVHSDSALLELQEPRTSKRANRSLAGAVDAERGDTLDARNRAVQKDGAIVVEER